MSIGDQVIEAKPGILIEGAGSGSRWAPWLFGPIIFLSAFLLFLVQPILGKMILPWFGGGAGVWSACLLYFQASLLAGYAYAHCLGRYVSPRRQMQIHILMLAGSIFLLPILPSPEWRHLGQADPAIRILGLLASTIGLPYLLISSTSPLLQAWYAAIKPGASAYRLYALSNLGSMLGLICFPVLVEPRLTIRAQAWGWSGGYVIFALLSAVVAWYAWKHRARDVDSPTAIDAEIIEIVAKPGIGVQTLWVALAACGVAIMMGATSYITQNFAPIPLLWVLPLGIYLLSFVLCFELERVIWMPAMLAGLGAMAYAIFRHGGAAHPKRSILIVLAGLFCCYIVYRTKHLYNRVIWMPAMLAGLSAMAYVMFRHDGRTNLKLSAPVMLAGLFCCCMVCHGELARHKPATRFLTYFYLLTSTGGVLGGFFVALVAPRLFKTYVELPLGMLLCVVLALIIAWKETSGRSWMIQAPVRVGLLAFSIALAAYMGVHKQRMDSHYHLQVRNFYGVLQVEDLDTGDPDGRVRSLFHGTIEHGAQLLDPQLRHEPTLYYLRSSGAGLAMQFIHARSQSVRVGAIGLGAGVLASYCRIGDLYRFYEINPEVTKIANSEFTFLRDCRGDLDVLPGDARLTLEGQPPQDFDLLLVDAFSGDSIPVHLLTREALLSYFRHLKRDGILAVHVSNKYLDLVPIVAGIAANLGKSVIAVYDRGEQGRYTTSSDWVLVASNPEIFDDKIFDADAVATADADPKIRMWTDDYSNLFQIMIW
jgi:spermidine synthase